MTVTSGACVYRPLPPRVTVDELIADSLNRSNAHRGGDESFVEHSQDIPWQDEVKIADGGWLDGQWVDELPRERMAGDENGSQPLNSPAPRSPAPRPKVSSGQSYRLSDLPAPADDSFRVNEEFIETDVREVLTMITTEADLDLVMDDNVGGIVNARVDNMPVDAAIEKVLMPLGLAHIRRGDQIIVAPPDPSSPLFSHIAVKRNYRPLHLDSAALLQIVPADWQQYVTSIESAKLLLVHAPAAIADEIVDRFESVDQPIPQVVLEAIICVVSPDCGFQFGLDWQHAVELDGAKSLAAGATGLAMSGSVSKDGLKQIFSEFSSTSAFIKLLNEHGYLTIRATPHVMAKDGEQANIAINRETFFSVQPPGSTGDNAVFFQQDIQKVDAGITLDITPHIRGDVVTIDIEKAEVSEDVRTASSELSVNPFPVINRRSVSTTVSVKDGKTIVIGGLVQRETVDRVNRVPGLSRLPGVGYLFQTTQRQTRDAEVVIFISPRIIRAAPAAPTPRSTDF